MTLEQMLAAAREALTAKLAERNTAQDALMALRASLDTDTSITPEIVENAIARRDALDGELDTLRGKVTDLEGEIAREAEVLALSEQRTDTGARPAYDGVARVGSEERTYEAHKEPGFDKRTGQFRRGAKPGSAFQADVVAAFRGDYDAQARLARHTAEERVERGEYLERAAGTGAFAGLVVPQYLTDLYAPAAAAKRPFADAIRSHPLPATGMTVNLSRITTSTSTAVQSSENSNVSETDIDDTLMTISVQTNAGRQTLSRQAVERGSGVEDVVLDDLFRQYATTLDSTLINQATNGLVNVATAVTYTDASPTAAELYPKVLESLSGVEAALLDQASGENIAVMHSRRWYWMQSQVGTSWPFLGQPGLAAQQGGVNYGEAYGSGVRGLLPNGTPVIVDNNVPTNLGAGTNEDRVFLADRNECHLWEDPSAPMFIRAEQTKVESLGIVLVVYGYFAYTHARYAHSRQVSGTGLVTPTF